MENDLCKILVNSPAETARKASNGKYLVPKHIAYLDKLLVDLAYRRSNRLIVNMPPRHGKSELISKYFPFWYLGNFPQHKIILSSYEATFAASWGRKVRDLVASDGKELFGIELADGSTAIQSFSLKSGGSMNTAGAGGAITGKGANLLIIDDPIKNDAEAHSPTIRDNVWDWFLSTAFTRIEPNGIVIIIMTRWNEDDLCGRLEEQFRDDWQIIKLPAIAEDDDPLGRQPGEALWNERFPIAKLNEISHQIGSYWFSSLYQQSPTGQDAAIFKRIHFKYFTIENNCYISKETIGKKYFQDDCMLAATMDLAISTNEKSDYTVVLVFAISPNRDIFIFDVVRERIDPSKHLELLLNIHSRYKLKLIGIESVQYQTTLLKQAQNAGLPIKALKADRDKFTRALPIATLMEAAKVYFLQSASWLGEFERELLAFPNGKHDDQVDAFSYISAMIPTCSKTKPLGKGRLLGCPTDF